MLAIGGHGLAVQVVLMRELMAVYAGNEFTAVAVLGTWLGVEAVGAWLAGRVGQRNRAASPALAGLAAALLSTLVVVGVVLTRPLFGLMAGEQPGLGTVIGAALLVTALPAFLHGLLFVEGVARFVGASGIGRGYAWEGLGTAAAGLLVAAVLLAVAPGLMVAAGFGVLLLAGCAAAGLFRGTGKPVAALAAVGLILLGCWAGPVERLAWQLAWPGFRVTETRESRYGRTVVMEREGERTVIYDGVPRLLTPDAPRSEQTAVVPLLHAAGVRDVLLLDSDLSVVEPLLRLPVGTVTFVAQDPVLFAARVETGNLDFGTQPRFRFVADDPRRFLRRTRGEYDCIISTGSLPLSLAANRLATVEHFRLCRERLRPGGVLAVPLPGGVSGVGRATALLLGLNRKTLEAVFDTVLMLALDSPMLVAGNRDESGVSADWRPEALAARLADWRRGSQGDATALDSSGLVRLLDRFRQERLELELAAATTPGTSFKENHDWQPHGLFLALARQAQESGSRLARLHELPLRVPVQAVGIAAAVLLLLLVLFTAGWGVATRRTLAIASSGFAGSALVSLGMFVYQAATGTLYLGLALLLACFTLGTVAGGWLGRDREQVGDRSGPVRPGDPGFIAAETLLVATALLMALAQQRLPGWVQFPLLAAVGVALGFQFPRAAVAGRGSTDGEEKARRRVGVVSAADLAGGILGVFVVLLVVVPVAGLGWAYGAVAALKLASLVVQSAPAVPARN